MAAIGTFLNNMQKQPEILGGTRLCFLFFWHRLQIIYIKHPIIYSYLTTRKHPMYRAYIHCFSSHAILSCGGCNLELGAPVTLREKLLQGCPQVGEDCTAGSRQPGTHRQ